MLQVHVGLEYFVAGELISRVRQNHSEIILAAR